MTEKISVLILMGSDSDWEVMADAANLLKQFKVPFEARVSSAHRTPERTIEILRNAENHGCRVIIAGAGAAAHLAGVVAGHTILPVIGVPLNATSLQGLDALLATVQMPVGIPVATMAIGNAGAGNAALLALQILAVADPELAGQLTVYRKNMVVSVQTKDQRLQERLNQE